ncbi:hypothetical protein [Enhydrobacter aerosaccus]|nr:hypothetical protein [Enhydrobacter aerosaccus]
MIKKVTFWAIYGGLLFVVTIGGLEFISFLVTPSWPAYELRPVAVPTDLVRQAAGGPETIPFYNSWSMKDRERSFEKPPGIRTRVIFNGDSFLEGMFSLAPLNEVVEARWASAGVRDMEAVNFGISATGPSQYYYRIADIGLALRPDAILLMFYPGNDFVTEGFSAQPHLPFVAERPLPSLLGGVAPHLTWQIVNRLGLSEIAGGNKGADNEYHVMTDAMKKSRAERTPLVAAYMKKQYFPDMSQALIESVLSRNDGSFWQPFERTDDKAEMLTGWLVASLIKWETGSQPLPHDAAEAEHMVEPRRIEATLSWLVALDDLAKAKGIKLIIAVAPMGSVDPAYVDFWRPWPRYYSWNLRQEANRRHLVAALRAKGFAPIDLEEDMNGIDGTYRLSDGHWTALGTAVVARRVGDDLLKWRASRGGGTAPSSEAVKQ